jgi:hypothetical protein
MSKNEEHNSTKEKNCNLGKNYKKPKACKKTHL